MQNNIETEEDWEEQPREMLVPTRPTWATKLRYLYHRHWNPSDVNPPTVDPDLPHLTGIERTAELIRHFLQSFEHWISPKGWLREWLRFNFKLALILAVPSLLVMPLVSIAVGQVNTWTQLLATTTNNMIYFPLSALLVVGLISALVYFGKSLRRRPDPRGQYGSQYYQ